MVDHGGLALVVGQQDFHSGGTMAGREVWSHYCSENCTPNMGVDLVEIKSHVAHDTRSQAEILAEHHGA